MTNAARALRQVRVGVVRECGGDSEKKGIVILWKVDLLVRVREKLREGERAEIYSIITDHFVSIKIIIASTHIYVIHLFSAG